MNKPLPQTPPLMTVAEFLPWAEGQKQRYELVRGMPVAMAPERLRHALVKHKVARAIEGAIERAGRDCTVFPDGVTIVIDDWTSYEPDAVVSCGTAFDLDKVTLDHPLILVEVMSPSSGLTDSQGKFGDYFSLASLRHYLVLDPVRRILFHHRRGDGASIVTEIHREGRVMLQPPGIELAVADLFVDEKVGDKA